MPTLTIERMVTILKRSYCSVIKNNISPKILPSVMLWGPPGVGKTFLSNCIAKELIDQSNSVVYLSSYQLFDTLAKGRFDKDEMSERINKHLSEK